MTPTTPGYPAPDNSGNMKTALLAGAVIALLGANVYLYVQIDHLEADVAKMRDGLSTEITSLKETSSISTATHRKNLDTLKDELASARTQASAAAGAAKTEASNKVDQLAKRVEAEQQKVAAQQQQQATELTEVKQAASTANAKIGDVSGEVTTVKNQVTSNKAELERTIADLKKVTGDLGVQSGYIATNGKELALLKRLGERSITEFKLARTKEPQRIGDIALLLKKTDLKKNKYTVEVVADDKRTEKKDKGVNEPVQFYLSKARQPYEIVVNEVKKDLIVGYLAAPKDQVARN